MSRCNESPTNVYVYIQIYPEIYVRASLGGCNFSTFYPSKLKFGYATYPDLNFQLCVKVASRSCPVVGIWVKIYNKSLVYIEIYTDIYISISLGGHKLGTFYARLLKLSMLLTQM